MWLPRPSGLATRSPVGSCEREKYDVDHRTLTLGGKGVGKQAGLHTEAVDQRDQRIGDGSDIASL